MAQATILDSTPCQLGEGAHWQAGADCLWWVDIHGGRLFRHWPARQLTRTWTFPNWITRVIPVDAFGDTARATMHSALGLLDVAGDTARFTPTHDLGQEGMRFNDGQVDPDGRWWAGTMRVAEDQPKGQWLRFDASDRSPQVVAEGFTVTNGPCFDTARGVVYLTDSAAQVIFRGTYDPQAGVRDLAPWRQFEAGQGYPDGMTIGPDGHLWIAFWDVACLRALDALGRVVREVALPVRRPTSIAFASDTLAYVTSAAVGLEGDDWQGRVLTLSLA